MKVFKCLKAKAAEKKMYEQNLKILLLQMCTLMFLLRDCF